VKDEKRGGDVKCRDAGAKDGNTLVDTIAISRVKIEATVVKNHNDFPLLALSNRQIVD